MAATHFLEEDFTVDAPNVTYTDTEITATVDYHVSCNAKRCRRYWCHEYCQAKRGNCIVLQKFSVGVLCHVDVGTNR